MKINKLNISYRFIMFIVFFCLISTIFVSIYYKDSNRQNSIQTVTYLTIDDYENKQVYDSKDGKHTIYWAKGIKAPLMTSDESLFGTENYFEKNVYNTYVSYDYIQEDNKGYYDLNKNKTSSHCYLASAVNLIHWWLDQNEFYVKKYLNHLNSDDVYSQIDGLKELIPFDENMWNKILTKPKLELVNNERFSQELYEDILTNLCFKVYLKKEDDGYFMDKVWDYFFNGYIPIEGQLSLPNDENNFKKSSTGGYFYPIFGKKIISKRYLTGKYDFYNDNLIKLIQKGKGVSFSYYSASDAHAITVWGAENDANGNLCRIYITDSDDFQMYNQKNKIVYGLRSIDVHSLNNAMYLSNNTDPNAPAGGYMNGMYVLDLCQDLWSKKINDITDPEVPEIVKQSNDAGYMPGAIADKIEINAKVDDTGYLTYKWYESNSLTSLGQEIVNENKPYYVPKVENLGTKYYYCLITNNKNGKEVRVKSRFIKIVVDDTLIDAKEPIINDGDFRTVKVNQYDVVNPIYVNAHSQDGGILSYQWYGKWGMVDSTVGGGTLLKGETNSFYIPQTNIVQRASYYCIVTNTKNDATGKKTAKKSTKWSKVINVENEKKLINATVPIIGKGPVSATYKKNEQSLFLSVISKASDAGTLSYQWYKAKDNKETGEKILDATSNKYQPATNIVGNLFYYCKVTNTNNLAEENKVSFIDTQRVQIKVIGEASNNNYLKELIISNATMYPSFDKNIFNYNVTVPYEILKLDVTATAFENAKINIINNELVAGEKTVIKVNVVAENGEERVYSINVFRKNYIKSNNNYISSIKINNVLINDFDKNKISYDLEVENDVEEISILAFSEDAKSNITGIGKKLLTEGKNNIFEIICTAENGNKKIYKINVFRKLNESILSSNNYLKSIIVEGQKLNPLFDKNIYNYEVNVKNGIVSIEIKAFAEDSKSIVSGVGLFSLNEGLNAFEIKCKSENNAVKTYTINVYREALNKENVDENNSNDEIKLNVPMWKWIIVGTIFIVIFVIICVLLFVKRKKD